MSTATGTRNKSTAKSASRSSHSADRKGLLNAATSTDIGPMQIPLSLIDEDPEQPRRSDNPGFSDESLRELADTIRFRGVKTPISVRNHPRAKGRYLINHGARRFRASALAGKTTIPGFVDNDYNNADQVLENLQRNQLTPREIADYIGRELARGKLKRDIAKGLGKSPAFVSQHVTLLSLPDPIAEAFSSGRSRDVTLINDLVTVYEKNPEQVTVWISDETQEITRASLKLLREFLDYKQPEEFVVEEPETRDEDQPAKSSTSAPGKLKRAIVQVHYKGRTARLILNRRPPSKGFAWLKYEGDGQVVQARLANVQLVALLEGYKPSTAKEGS
jgi:ParB family transcriptional regulator, chromosome partitioning protein